MGYTLELIKFLLIIGVLAFGSYFVAKKIKKGKWSKESAGGLIEMQDVLKVGMNQTVSLVRIGDEYVLLATTGTNVSMIKLDAKEVTSPKASFEEAFSAHNATSALKDIKERLGEKLK